MSVVDIMKKRNALSFELFPPKTDVGMEKICGAELYENASSTGYTPPKEDILILSVRISEYTAEDAALNELHPAEK